MKTIDSSRMKTKILFIMHMPPPVHGASMVGKYIKDSEKVNSAFECRYINMTLAQSLEDIGKGGVKKLIAYWDKLKEIRKTIKEFQPDVVYVTPNSAGGPFYKDYVIVKTLQTSLLREASRRANGKVGQIVLHFHNKGVRTRQDRWLDDKLYRRFFRGVKVMLLAEGLYKDVEKYVARENVLICPNGIPDIDSPNFPAQGDLNTNTNHTNIHESKNSIHFLTPGGDRKRLPIRLLWLTNIMLTKGVMEYLEALRILKKQGVEFVADFVGGETREMSSEAFDLALTTKGLTDCCYYHGKKYGDEKDEFFRKADVFVLPSYTEAFPLTILEAMQYGKAVVATNVGGISAEIEDGVNGFLLGGKVSILDNVFQPDAKEIADAIGLLANDRVLCKRMGEAGRKKYVTEFTLSAFEENFINCLNSISHE